MTAQHRDTELHSRFYSVLARRFDDEQAWAILHKIIRPLVLATACRNLRGHLGLAEDACQEVFLRLVRFGPFSKIKRPEDFRKYVCAVS